MIKPEFEPAAALHGVTVLEVAGGVAGAYCAKLFADLGAKVNRLVPPGGDPAAAHLLEPGEPSTRGLYTEYLGAGKTHLNALAEDIEADLLILGEETDHNPPETDRLSSPRVATLDLRWFGADGPWAHWSGTDLCVQAAAGLMHPVGPVEGPPTFLGVHQAALLGGTAAFGAGIAALLGRPGPAQHLEVSIFESIIILSELQICHSEMLGHSVPRLGVNRFQPTCPLSIHRCREGWIGITPLTPAQWQAFCDILDLPDLATDPDLLPPRGRFPFAERIEAAVDMRFPSRTAEEWAALGRERKVPMVLVPDAQGILAHPIFNQRDSLASFSAGESSFRVPRTPIRLQDTPPKLDLDSIEPRSHRPAIDPTSRSENPRWAEGGNADAPLHGVRVIDFSMGWAGPLATRMLADLGAEVIKIEAGRYPDWWRSVDWSPEAIADYQYEQSRHFSALNRGKRSVSIDLTSSRGVALAKTLVAQADIVVENQAAGVMDRLGLGFDQLSEDRDDLIMLSMSAFGAGNDWSETRAYGSVLEQGSGGPSFAGQPDWPPTLTHIAHGDPVGGLYGGVSLLTALFHRQRSGKGQWINNTQIEAMLPATTPALLVRQVTGREPLRLGNRHPVMIPHGCFPCTGDDRWVVIACDDRSWPALARAIGRGDWADDPKLALGEGRRAREQELEAAVAGWTKTREACRLAEVLQRQGVSAAPVLRMDEITSNAHLRERSFFYAVDRPHVGHQLQTGLPVRRDRRQRYAMRGLAPELGADSKAVLGELAGVTDDEFQQLVSEGIVSFKPTQLRSGTS